MAARCCCSTNTRRRRRSGRPASPTQPARPARPTRPHPPARRRRMNRPSKLSFIDEGEAVRRLDVDRDTLLTLVREKRLKSYPGVGKGAFFRLNEVEALARELRGAAEATADEETAAAPGKGKLFDPAYKVHVRLQAD